ncbi:MAG TPA: hypothetical protein VM101_15565 [Flavitalea sp.]|nr:hypothetical protein [Flavitalea sp.]
MKKLFIIYLLLVSCNTTNYSAEGCYTCKYEHEFAITSDTLCLRRIDGTYRINRHSGVFIKATGKEKLLIELWKLSLNKNVFTEIKTGRTFTWNRDRQSLIFGNRIYILNK